MNNLIYTHVFIPRGEINVKGYIYFFIFFFPFVCGVDVYVYICFYMSLGAHVLVET